MDFSHFYGDQQLVEKFAKVHSTQYRTLKLKSAKPRLINQGFPL